MTYSFCGLTISPKVNSQVDWEGDIIKRGEVPLVDLASPRPPIMGAENVMEEEVNPKEEEK